MLNYGCYPTEDIDLWVGFLYTFVVKVTSTLGVTKTSKNGMEPSGPASFMVNLMEVSTSLICWKNSSLCDLLDYKGIIHISSPYPRRVQCSVDSSVLKKPPCRYLPQLGSLVIPWQHLWSVQIIDSGKGSICFSDRTPAIPG